MKNQVEERLKFLSTGVKPRKNLDVMKEIFQKLGQKQVEEVEEKEEKVLKKKSKRSKEVVVEEEEEQVEEEVPKKKKKVKA